LLLPIVDRSIVRGRKVWWPIKGAGEKFMSVTKRFASWLALVTMLIALPPSISGHYECSLGMSQAGPACPICRGESSAPTDGPSVKGDCCRYVEAKAVSLVVRPSLRPVMRSPAPTLTPHAAVSNILALASSLEPICQPPSDRAAPSGPAPLYLSNFLRL
jgi:hypothetical protein